MNLKNYLKDKYIYLLIISFTYFIILSFMWGFKVSKIVILTLTFLYFMLFFILFLIDYLRKYFFYQNLQINLQKLNEKYLICELVSKPDFIEGTILVDTLYEINKSMSENLASYKKQNIEFREYVELWIHEVKIPLSALILYVHNHSVSPKILKEIENIDEYLEQILYYIRSENSEKDYIIKDVKLKQVMREIMLKNKNVLLSKYISVQIDVDDICVLTDYKWLLFMINQIFSNSIKYMKDIPNKKIDVKAYLDNNKIILAIKDNGIGIPKSDITKVFQKTFTGKNGRKLGSSTGMGLYIVKSLCKKLGHKVEIESKEDEYTKVILTFDNNLYYKDVTKM